MRQLRGHGNAPVAPGRDGTLPVQRLRAVPQDERSEQAADPAQEETGRAGGRRGAEVSLSGFDDL